MPSPSLEQISCWCTTLIAVRETTSDEATLQRRFVGDLDGHFFVPRYQRGYRWGEHEVGRLLDDIQHSGNEPYFLQPIVVKRLGDGR